MFFEIMLEIESVEKKGMTERLRISWAKKDSSQDSKLLILYVDFAKTRLSLE